MKILLVDDNSLVRESFKSILKFIPEANIVAECSDGNEVLYQLKSRKINIVFMDILMKHTDGYEATKIVKAYDSNIKVIGFSFLDYTAVGDRMRASGADGFISKWQVTRELIIDEIKKVSTNHSNISL